MNNLTSTTEQQVEAPSELKERGKLKALVYPFEVIVSPFKAFKKITQNPSVIGLLLVGALILLSAATAEYSRAAKIILHNGTLDTSLLNSDFFGTRLIVVLARNSYYFLLNWIFYAGILLLMARFFGVRGGPWRQFFVVVGYVFFVWAVYFAINALLFPTLPEIHFEMSAWSSQTPEDMQNVAIHFQEVWGPTFVFQIQSFLAAAFWFWLVLLGAIALHSSREIPWGKAIMTALVAYFLSVLITTFLLSF